MKNRKVHIRLLLALALFLMLSGCGGKDLPASPPTDVKGPDLSTIKDKFEVKEDPEAGEKDQTNPGKEEAGSSGETDQPEPAETKDPAPDEDTQPPVENGPTLTQRLEGIYCAAGEDPMADEAHVIQISVVGGLVLIEHQQLAYGSVYSYWAQEIWPEDAAALESTQAAQLVGLDYQFSTFSQEGSYWDGTDRVLLELTDEELTLTQLLDDTGLTTQFVPIENDSVQFHNPPEFFPWIYDLPRPDELAGSWQLQTKDLEAWLCFAQDGSFQYILKQTAQPIFWLRGVWGLEENGAIHVISEQFGGGTMPLEYSLFCSRDEGQLRFTDTGGLPLGGYTDPVFTSAKEIRHFSSSLLFPET